MAEIKKVKLKSGKTRYRSVIDIGRDADGNRKQLTITMDTAKEVRTELARVQHQRSAGTYVTPSAMTLGELLDMWMKSKRREIEETTASSHDASLLPVRDQLGHKRVQEVIEDDVEDLIDWMLTSGRRRPGPGGGVGSGLAVGTVERSIGLLRSALNLAVRRHLVVRNVAQHVSIPREARKKDKARKRDQRPWGEAEVKAFLDGIRGHRLEAALLLALMAERPAEVCGARWLEDVDLEAKTIDISNTRTVVYDRDAPKGQKMRVVEKDAKSAAGNRMLPLPEPVFKALKAARAQQAREKLAAGEGYVDSGYVVVDELGSPLRTYWLRWQAHQLMEQIGVRRVRLYDARHACLSWMANNGVPDTVVSAWAGHTDLSFTKRIYVHSDPQSLAVGAERLGDLLS